MKTKSLSVRFWRVLLVLGFSAACVQCLAGTPAEPQANDVTPARIKGAKKRYEELLNEAQTAFLKAELTAKTAYLRSIKSAMAEATKAGQLEQAVAINKEKEQIELEMALIQRSLAGVTTTFKVAANRDWQSLMQVHKGDVLQIRATGVWCNEVGERKRFTTDANGDPHRNISDFVPNTPYSALIGRVGEQRFLVGSSATIHVEEDGKLEMRINDKGTDDNDGELSVVVFAKGAKPDPIAAEH